MIFIAGPHASGKTHLAEILKEYNLNAIDLGPILRNLFIKSGYVGSFTEWVAEGERKGGKNFTDELLVKEIQGIISGPGNEGNAPYDFLILGNRSWEGIRYIQEHIGAYNEQPNVTLFIDAQSEVLYERYKKRERKNMTQEQFTELLNKDIAMGLNGIKDHADHYIINNDTEEELRSEFLKLFKEWLNHESKVKLK